MTEHVHHFRVVVAGQPAAEIFGEGSLRNWVLWKLSEYVLAFKGRGTVTVDQRINGAWENCNDWRKLAH